MPRDSRDAALDGRDSEFARARGRDTATAAGGNGKHADMIDVRQAGQIWDFLLSFAFGVQVTGCGVAVMQGA